MAYAQAQLDLDSSLDSNYFAFFIAKVYLPTASVLGDRFQ